LLVPELFRVSSFTTTALVGGAVWSVYHYPQILFADYGSGVPKWFGMIAFTWMVVASGFVYAWLRLKSGSVWPAVFLHASHNLFIQQVFDPLTSDRGPTKYVTTEFGIGLALGYSFLAWYAWRRRGELYAAAPGPTQVGARSEPGLSSV
jgi:membrane protease YdiL (CAAX protease family)